MDSSFQFQSRREAILAELATIFTIERGSLTEEYREVPSPEGGGTIKKGPYFKHQCWENKRNRSKRIPDDEVALLREDLENGQLFQQLIEQLAELNVAEARERRKAHGKKMEDAAQLDAKKNSTNKPLRKDTAKPNRSSKKSPSASKPKDSKT
jgi:hypothetical protein